MKARTILLGSLLLVSNSSRSFCEDTIIARLIKIIFSHSHATLLQSTPPRPADPVGHQSHAGPTQFNNYQATPPAPSAVAPAAPKFNTQEFERFMTDEIRRINGDNLCDSWWSNDSVICAQVKDTKNSFADLLWKSKTKNAEIIDDIKSIMKTYIVLFKSDPIVQNRWKKAYDRIFN